MMLLWQGIAPLTLNLTKPDPVFDDGFMPLSASEERPIRVAMSNSFGFGGTNAALLFAHTDSDWQDWREFNDLKVLGLDLMFCHLLLLQISFLMYLERCVDDSTFIKWRSDPLFR